MKFVFAAVSVILAAACAQDAAEKTVAEAVYVNGSIWTGERERPRAEAIAVSGGKILSVGSNETIDRLVGDETRVVDLDGAFVVPGFIDNHTHFLGGGFSLASVQLRDAASPEEFSRRIGDFAAAQPAGRWIQNGEWDHENWGGELPRKEWIDELTRDNPVLVWRLDGHMALANSLAIERAGVTAETPDPVGGEIVRDENGEPTGVFKDTAADLITAVIPPPSNEEYDGALNAAMARAVSRGVTQIHDMSSGAGDWASLAAFRRAQATGALDMRIYAFVHLSDWMRAKDYVDENGRGDDWLRWGGVKAYTDGSLGSTTALFYEPYDDAQETSGLFFHEPDELKGWIMSADAAGLHVTVHAIGDRANDWLLDVFEETAATNGGDIAERRFRVEHTQHLSADAIARFGALGVIPSMQPYHAIDDGRWAEKRIGPDRIKRTYAFRSLLDAGAPLTFGSDWTVAPISPLDGIYAAVTRRTLDGANPDGWIPQEKISVEEALVAYTRANAYAGYQEDRLGVIATGMLADFVVLSDDLIAIDPVEIKTVRVLRTVIGGEDKYAAE